MTWQKMQQQADQHKAGWYVSLRGKIARLMPGWKVETLAFSLGIRRSYTKDKW